MIDTSLDTSNFYFLIAVIQGIVLSIIISFQKPTGKPNIFFGVLLFLLSVSLLHLVLEESIHAFNARFPVPMDYSLSYGPLTYFHVLYIKDPMRRFRYKDLLHFAPSLVLDVIFFSTFFIYISNNMEWALANVPMIQSISMIIAIAGLVQLGVYTYLIFKESRDARFVLKEFESVKKWLRTLLISWFVFIGFLIMAIPIALFYIHEFDDNSSLLYKPLGTILSICIYVLGYLYTLKYSKIVASYTGRVGKFKFSSNEIDEKKNQILDALRNEHLYKDPSITVSKLAGHLGWPINNLSGVINESLNTNFNDLINTHRVDAFKKIVRTPDSHKYSVLGLGQEVGFSSKASFYRVFKKETGMTPTEFIKSVH